ncbi:MAG: hypothetical protein RLZZ196_17 [Bacteroidota bacterium]|jgi:uncharacterized repeat protein (TIGR02543 family)
MPIYIKKPDALLPSGGSWSTNVKKVFVKASDGLWKSATRVFAKTTNGWVQMWPGDAPAVNQNDPINIRSGGYNGTAVGSPQYINAVLYGHDSNGASIVGATPITIDYRRMKIAQDDTGQTTRYLLESTDIYNLTSNTETKIGEKRFYADAWWLFYEISATNVWATSILYSFPPIKIIRRIPVVNSSTLTEDYTFGAGSFSLDFTISDLWYQSADWSRSYVRFWKNTSKAPGGTILQTEYLDQITAYTDTRAATTTDPNNDYPSYNGSGTTYSAVSTYTTFTPLAAGEYIIAEIVLQNSYTDHYGSVVSSYKSTGDKAAIVSLSVRDDNGNGVVDNQSTPRIMSDGFLNFTAVVNGAKATDYYLLEPKFYNWQNGNYYSWDTLATIASTSWPTDLTPDNVVLNGTTATVTWRIFIDANSLYAIGGPTYNTGQARWEFDFRVSSRASSTATNASANYFVGIVSLGSGASVYSSGIDGGAFVDIAPSSAMTLNVSATTTPVNQAITFSGTTASFPSGYASYPRRYQIDYGDGTTSSWTSFATGTSNPSFSGITKTYTTAGTYTAILQWDPQGDTTRSTRSRTITVNAALTAPTPGTVTWNSSAQIFSLTFTGGSGPYYQMYWYPTTSNPSNIVNNGVSYDAAGTASPISDDGSFGPTEDTTYYFWVRSSSENLGNTTVSGSATAGTYSNWSSTYSTWLGRKITYNYNGGTGSTASVLVTNGNSTTLPTPNTRTGFTFNGWYTAATGGTFVGSAGSSYSVNTSLTLYAQWTSNLTAPTPSTITYNGSGSWSLAFTGGSGPYYQLYWNTVSTIPTTAYYDAAGTSSPISEASVTPVNDSTYYWTVRSSTENLGNTTQSGTATDGTYSPYSTTQLTWIGSTVTYDATTNGGTTGTTTTGIVKRTTVVTLPSATRSGYSFSGWYTASTGGTRIGGAGDSYTVNSTLTLYAQFALNPQATGQMRRVTMPSAFTSTSQTIWVGTNGYVSVTADPTVSPGTSWPTAGGVVVGPFVNDNFHLALYTLADSSNFYVRWQGRHFNSDSTTTLDYLMKFYWGSTTVDVYFIQNSTASTPSIEAIRNGNINYSNWSASTSITGMTIPAGMTQITTAPTNSADDGRVAVTASKPVSVPVNITLPTLSPSTANVGTTLTFGVGTWSNSPTSYSLRLYRGTAGVVTSETLVKDAGNVTSSTYTIPQSDYDDPNNRKYYRAFATATNAGGTSNGGVYTGGTEIGPIGNAPALPPSGGTVSISTNTGNYNVGSVITVSSSGWSNATSYYVELHNGTNPVLTSDPLRASATRTTQPASITYTITSADVPNYFKGWCTATGSGGSTTASSVQVGPAAQGSTAPAAPTNPNVSTSGLVTWTASTGASSYTVEYYVASSAAGANASGPYYGNVGNVTSYQITYPTVGGVLLNYARARVNAANGAGQVSSYSAWYPSATTYV